MAFRQTGESYTRKIGRKRGDGDVLVTIHAKAVVNLVGENHELVAAGNLDNLLQNLARVDGARGVVGIDDDDGFGTLGNLSLHICNVGAPLGLLVAHIMHRHATGERGARGPKRIVGAGNEDLVTVVEQRIHGELDEFGDAIAGVDVLHTHVGQVLDLRVLHDGLARREEPARIRVALAVGQLLAHVGYDLVRRAETKGGRIADVELQDTQAFRLHSGGLVGHGAANIVENVIELGRLFELTHGCAPFRVGCEGVAGGRRPRGSSRHIIRRRGSLVNVAHLSWTRSGFLPSPARYRIGVVRRMAFVNHGVHAICQPHFAHAENLRKQRHDIATRHGLPTYILADLAFSEPAAVLGSSVNYICLLHSGAGHRLDQPCGKRLLARHLPSFSSI